MVRPDIIKILTYAKRKGFYIVLFTNATLMTPYLAEELRELNINEMEISLYGMTLKTYEEITQVPGSFDRCIEGIQLLCQMDINISLKMMVLTFNLAEFDRIKSFAEKLEVPFLWNYQVDPRIDGSGEPLKHRISPETAVDLELRVKSHLSEEKKNTRKKQNLSSKKNAFFHCDAGKNSITISPYGEIILCLGYRFPQYDLRRGSVAEGWRELVKYVKSIKPDSSYQCGECEFENDCLWCPSDGWLNKKDGNVCNPYYRELAELRRGKERGWIA